MQEIQIEVRDVYGTPRAYPVCETARAFAQIAETSTLTLRVLVAIEKMGYDIVIVSHRGDTIRTIANHNQEGLA